MSVESISPFLLVIAPFVVAFLLEAVVIRLFGLKSFWGAVGVSTLVNLLTLAVLYGAGLLLGKLGYNPVGLQVPLSVMVFFWWLSIIADALLLQLFTKRKTLETIFHCSIAMNTLSYIFLYLIVTY